MILFVADQFADASRDAHHAYPGGAELTDAAVIEAAPDSITLRTFATLQQPDVESASAIIIGNAATIKPEQLLWISSKSNVILFEHDLRLCHRRGDMTVPHHPLHQCLEWCACRRRKVLQLMHTAKGVIYLTDYQRRFYHRNPWYQHRPYRVIGSSVFDRATIDLFRNRETSSERSIEIVVPFSKHTAKGFEDSLAHARTISSAPYVMKDVPPSEVLQLLRQAKRFIHLPRSPEWAGRLPVEARFMGCEVIINHRVGVAQESWWSFPDNLALQHLGSAADRFWGQVNELLR